VNVSITASGQELLAHAPSLLQDEFCKELHKLQDWERTLMLSILQRIAAMMEAEEWDAAPHLVTDAIEREHEQAPSQTAPGSAAP
jgi:hypothetical protein